MILVRCPEWAEKALENEQILCPHRGCDGVLGRWGYGRRRGVRGPGTTVIEVRPQRARCRGCKTTHVLLPAALAPRRADTAEVIGTALVYKAQGLGYQRIAATLGRPPSTVRRWLRSAADPAHLHRLWQRGAQKLIPLNADAFNALAATANLLHDTLNILATAAWWTRQRLGITEPMWTLIGLYTGGRLLSAPG
jgi:hypothetical protein